MRNRQAALLYGTAVAFLLYQISIGGDVWTPYWRIATPAMPVFALLAAFGIQFLVSHPLINARLPRLPDRFPGPLRENSRAYFWVLFALMMLVANYPFLPEIVGTQRPFDTDGNEIRTNVAIILNHVTTQEATLALWHAGTMAYYTDREAIDVLGKSDRHIAALPPDTSGAVSFRGVRSVPGHNKYDLEYSIVRREPTYIQQTRWGRQDISAWARDRYVTVRHKDVELLLRRDSDRVRWDRVAALDDLEVIPAE